METVAAGRGSGLVIKTWGTLFFLTVPPIGPPTARTLGVAGNLPSVPPGVFIEDLYSVLAQLCRK